MFIYAATASGKEDEEGEEGEEEQLEGRAQRPPLLLPSFSVQTAHDTFSCFLFFSCLWAILMRAKKKRRRSLLPTLLLLYSSLSWLLCRRRRRPRARSQEQTFGRRGSEYAEAASDGGFTVAAIAMRRKGRRKASAKAALAFFSLFS